MSRLGLNDLSSIKDSSIQLNDLECSINGNTQNIKISPTKLNLELRKKDKTPKIKEESESFSE